MTRKLYRRAAFRSGSLPRQSRYSPYFSRRTT